VLRFDVGKGENVVKISHLKEHDIEIQAYENARQGQLSSNLICLFSYLICINLVPE
jgi:hypothetical protein